MKFWNAVLLGLLFLSSCSEEDGEKLFHKLDKQYSGVDFVNQLTITEEFNPYTFKAFFNGGGVAIGDINNDGLEDIYFTGNQVPNRLYLNQGNLKFKDISQPSGTCVEGVWSTGATFVDLNMDGHLDLYVCRSGDPDTPFRSNELYINNGDLTFTAAAEEYGLAYKGLSTHATFFDYDRDGDLDIYLLNNSIRSVGHYDIRPNLREVMDTIGGNRLLKNNFVETGKVSFYDVTEAAGIYGSDIGFGLGVISGDLNGDTWPDIYVSNDFFEKDYLYLNNHDGTFSESSDEAIQEMEMGAMGADIADINNDGRFDIFVTEMLPTTLERYKSKANFESYNKHEQSQKNGYHNQVGRNVLQVNKGLVDGQVYFQEVGRLAGVEASEWSWGALVQDFDNNGLKDIFIANGIAKDLLDQDYINFFNPIQIRKLIDSDGPVMTKLFGEMPSQKIMNHLYLNQGEYAFENVSEPQGLEDLTFSNGSAYSDLDNDGDLDLVINNINEESFIYENQSHGHFINIELDYIQANRSGIGSTINIYSGDQILSNIVNPTRGFQSSISTRCYFGLGNLKIDSIQVIWPNGKLSNHLAVIDTILSIDYKVANVSDIQVVLLSEATQLLEKVEGILDFTHVENKYQDFDSEPLLPTMRSNEGPVAEVFDFNNDGLDDILIGGSKGYPTSLFVANAQGDFSLNSQALFEETKGGENTDILATDIDHDGDEDVVVANGSNEFSAASSQLFDRLYINNSGKLLSSPMIGVQYQSTSAIAASNIGGNNKDELLIAKRSELGAYGVPGSVHVLELKEDTYEINQSWSDPMAKIGLVTDVVSQNIDADERDEVIIATEYGSIHVFDNRNGEITSTKDNELERIKGKWNKIEVSDLDNDGYEDILALNFGLNNRFRRLTNDTLYLFVNDFDGNGNVEQIVCRKEAGKHYPIHQRDDLLSQLPSLKRKALSYTAYAQSALEELFDQSIMERSIIYSINEWRSGIFYGSASGFKFVPLPIEAQMSEMYASIITDLNGDGLDDIVIGGNQVGVKPAYGGQLGSYGAVFINRGDRNMDYLSHAESGLFERGQIRDIEVAKIGNTSYLIVLKNNMKASTYRIGAK